MFGAKHAHQHHDPTLGAEWLSSCRKVLLCECRKIGKNGRERVGLRVLHAVDRIIWVTNPKRFRRAYDGNWSSITNMTIAQVLDATEIGLKLPRLGTIRPQTWSEQIAGRASLMAKHTWPDLMPD
jgi:hypothetical protein